MNPNKLFLAFAEQCADQSTCLSSQYGAIITDIKNRIPIGIGYNGAPSGMPECKEKGECLKLSLGYGPGTGRGFCCCCHAEVNAIINCISDPHDCIMYLFGKRFGEKIKPVPCFQCTKAILNAGIVKVITPYTIYDPIELYNYYIDQIYNKTYID